MRFGAPQVYRNADRRPGARVAPSLEREEDRESIRKEAAKWYRQLWPALRPENPPPERSPAARALSG